MESTPDNPNVDTLNEIGVLKRREIEARIVAPLIERFAEEFGEEKVVELARETVVDVARSQGKVLAEAMGGNDLEKFADSMENWTKGGALQIEIREQSETTFAFDVVRCQYAEMYRNLDVPELGALLSCNRDGSFCIGFDSNIKLDRAKTIMDGDPCCTFRYRYDVEEP